MAEQKSNAGEEEWKPLEENGSSDGAREGNISLGIPDTADTNPHHPHEPTMASLTPAANASCGEKKRSGEGKSTKGKDKTNEEDEDISSMEVADASPQRIEEEALRGLMPMPSLERTVPSGPGAYAVVSHIRSAPLREHDTANWGNEQGLEMASLAAQDSSLVQAYPVSDPVVRATAQRVEGNYFFCVSKRISICVLVSIAAGITAIVSSSLAIRELFVSDPKRTEHQQIKQSILDAFGESYFNNPQKKKALHWMIYQDPRNDGLSIMEQGYHQNNLIQRFSLVAFYFQTSVRQPWKYCNPPVGEQSETCFFREEDFQKQDTMGTRWLTAAHECQWMGVVCETGTKAVKELQLVSNNLTGSIPAEEIAMLTSLRELDLGLNKLAGTLPNGLLQINSLQALELFSNNLMGSIQRQAFLMPNLITLGLGSNHLTGSIPPEVRHYGGDRLSLINNLLTGSVPKEMYGARNLKSLSIGNNLLTGTLSAEIGLLTHLYYISVEGNPIGGHIASEIGLLHGLTTLEVSRSNMGGTIPEELYHCQKLYKLSLNKNQVSGTISTRVGLLNELSFFEFEDTKISGTLPEELGSLPLLVKLAISGNGNMTGSIPESLCLHGHQRLKIVADCSPTLSTGFPVMFCPARCCSICCDAETNICYNNRG